MSIGTIRNQWYADRKYNRLQGHQELCFGIGLNVNQLVFHSDAPNPVSLAQILGHEVDREEVLKKILDGFESIMNCCAVQTIWTCRESIIVSVSQKGLPSLSGCRW